MDLERAYDVRIVTQNVDDLHERAGSTQVLEAPSKARRIVVHPDIPERVSGSQFEVVAKPAFMMRTEAVVGIRA